MIFRQSPDSSRPAEAQLVSAGTPVTRDKGNRESKPSNAKNLRSSLVRLTASASVPGILTL